MPSSACSSPPTTRATAICCRHIFATAISSRRGGIEEILEPELTVEQPVYRFSLFGRPPFKLEGRDQVAALYGHWTETDQCVFYVEDEEVAVGDHMIVGRGIGYQQTLGAELAAAGLDADEERCT